MEAEQLEAIQDQWDSLLQKGNSLHFSAGQVLFYEDHNPYGVYVIKSGEIRFTKGKRVCSRDHFHKLRGGRAVGIDHVIDDTPYCCTCTARTDCQVTFIPKTYIIESDAE